MRLLSIIAINFSICFMVATCGQKKPAVPSSLAAINAVTAHLDSTIACCNDSDGCSSQVYPSEVMELGYTLAMQGKFDDAFELTGDLLNNYLLLSGDQLSTNLLGTVYLSQLYLIAGDKEAALSLWARGKEYTLDHMDGFTEDGVQFFMESADSVINEIQKM